MGIIPLVKNQVRSNPLSKWIAYLTKAGDNLSSKYKLFREKILVYSVCKLKFRVCQKGNSPEQELRFQNYY